MIGHDGATVSLGHGGDDRVERGARSSLFFAGRHEPSLDQTGFHVDGQHVASEQCLRALWTGEPSLKLIAAFAGRRL
ncbi:hypothetical protein ASF26_06135 [Methylobacterium sp. Leaf93]|nr:hypothetical protein ASF26_06135 [Methylobacterium sp. Leaf93]